MKCTLLCQEKQILHLKDVIQVYSKEFRCENTHGMGPSIVYDYEGLSIFSKVHVALNMGLGIQLQPSFLFVWFIRLCLELLERSRTTRAHSKHYREARWSGMDNNKWLLNLCNSINPYRGYCKVIVAILTKVSYKNRFVQGEIWRHLGDLPLIPYQCVNEKDNPFLRDGS